MTPRQLGSFRIEETLGSGGMGVVYLARTPDGAQVALKSIAGALDPELLARFKREAKLLAQLDHPGLCRVRELVEQGPGAPYLVLDYVPGRPLSDLLRDDLDPGRAADLIAQVCDAVEHAHQAGVLHRDLKPSNVMVTPDGRAVVLDFGLARRVGDAESQALSKTGDVLGTPGYMPPEQALGEPLDARADVYGIGATLYACLTGEAPFRRGSILATFQAVLEEPPIPPRRLRADLPPGLEAVCLRALAKAPDQRFASAAELGEALRRPPETRARRWLGFGLALGVVSVVIAGVALQRPSGAPPDPPPEAPAVAAPADPTTAVPTSLPAPEESHPGPFLNQLEAKVRRFQGLPMVTAITKLQLITKAWRSLHREASARVDRQVELQPRNLDWRAARAQVALLFARYDEAIDLAARHPRHRGADLVRVRALWRRSIWHFWDQTHLRLPQKKAALQEANQRFDRLRDLASPADLVWRETCGAILTASWRAVPAEGLPVHEAHVLRSVVLKLARGDDKASGAELQQAVEAAPRAPLPRRLWAHFNVQRGSLPVGLASLRLTIALQPEPFDMWLAADYAPPTATALRDLLTLVGDRPIRLPGIRVLLRARLALREDRLDEAIVLARSAPPMPNTDIAGFARTIQAQAHLRRGQLDEALRLVRGVRSGASGLRAVIIRGHALAGQGKIAAASRVLDQIAKQPRLPAETQLLRAWLYLTTPAAHGAALTILRRLEAQDDRPLHRAWLGIGLITAGKLREAEDQLSLLRRDAPRSIYTHLLSGHLHAARDETDAAEAAYTRVIDAAPDERSAYLAYHWRGDLRSRRGQAQAARADWADSLRVNPSQPRAVQLRAKLKQP